MSNILKLKAVIDNIIYILQESVKSMHDKLELSQSEMANLRE